MNTITMSKHIDNVADIFCCWFWVIMFIMKIEI